MNVGVRLALVKNFGITEDVTYRDYKKFRSNARVVLVGAAQQQP